MMFKTFLTVIVNCLTLLTLRLENALGSSQVRFLGLAPFTSFQLLVNLSIEYWLTRQGKVCSRYLAFPNDLSCLPWTLSKKSNNQTNSVNDPFYRFL